MQTLDLNKIGLLALSEAEVLTIGGGDVGYGGKGPDLDRLSAIATTIGNFVQGFWDGLG